MNARYEEVVSRFSHLLHSQNLSDFDPVSDDDQCNFTNTQAYVDRREPIDYHRMRYQNVSFFKGARFDLLGGQKVSPEIK